jgi:hypothetical protein
VKNKTMKKLFFVATVTAFSILAKAQDSLMSPANTYSSTSTTGKTFIWSIGIEPQIPIGNFNNFSGFGLGGSLQGEYKPGKIGITANVGYIDYFGKTVNGFEYDDFKYWPVLGGLKFYMSDKSYIHGQAGAGFGTNGLGTSFWYGAGIGTSLGKTLDAELKYTGWKQNEITTNGNDGYNGGTGGGGTGGGGTGGGTGGGGDGGYGGHYSTIGLRLGINF